MAELAALAAPEMMFFCLAVAGMALFGSGMLGPFMARFFSPSPAALKAKKLIVEEEETLEAEEVHQSLEEQLFTRLREKNHAEAVRIWRELKFTMEAPTTTAGRSTLFVDLLKALRALGSTGESFIAELQQATEKNPALCEGEAMECLFLALDGERTSSTGGEEGLLKALAAALEEVDRLTLELRRTLMDLALRREEDTGLTEALEHLMNFPTGVAVPTNLGIRVLSVAGHKGRLPAAVALLKDVDVAWAEGALEAPMAEAKARNDAELCIQLHRAAGNLDIPRSGKECELLLACLEAANAPAALRVVADDIAQNPALEINDSLGLALIRAGVDDSVSPGLMARMLGRPASPLAFGL